jgi:hypothetical protein
LNEDARMVVDGVTVVEKKFVSFKINRRETTF